MIKSPMKICYWVPNNILEPRICPIWAIKCILGASLSCLKVFYCYFWLEVSLLGEFRKISWVRWRGKTETHSLEKQRQTVLPGQRGQHRWGICTGERQWRFGHLTRLQSTFPFWKIEGRKRERKMSFKGHWDSASLGNSHARTHPDSE